MKYKKPEIEIVEMELEWTITEMSVSPEEDEGEWNEWWQKGGSEHEKVCQENNKHNFEYGIGDDTHGMLYIGRCKSQCGDNRC